jgi:hypothetical protein
MRQGPHLASQAQVYEYETAYGTQDPVSLVATFHSI